VRITAIVRAGRLLVLLSLSLVPLPGTCHAKLHGTVRLADCPRPFEWASSTRARRVSGLDRNDARRLPARRLKERFRWPSRASGLAWVVYPPAISPMKRPGRKTPWPGSTPVQKFAGRHMSRRKRFLFRRLSTAFS